MDEDHLARLTEKQRESLRLVYAHFSSKEIARIVGVEPGTVDQYIKAALRILGVTDRRTAARILAEHEGRGPPPLPNLAVLHDDAVERAMAENAFVSSRDGRMALNPALFRNIHDLSLSPASHRLLNSDNIIYVGDLVQKTEGEIIRSPSFTRKSLDEIKEALAGLGLRLGLDVPGWPPENFEREVERLRAAQRATRIRQAPLGATFEPNSNFLAINPAGSESDYEASQRSAVQQLHVETIRKARQFGSVATRLDNQFGWQGISGLCERLVTLLDRPTNEVPEVVGSLYSAALELGSFFEMDRALRTGQASYATPLDAEVQRPFEDLLRSLAPWLRSFPTIKEMDDEAGQFLAPSPALESSAAVIETANQTNLISEDDAEILRGLIEAAKRGEFQGTKAGHRGHLSARNMVVAVVSVIGGLVLGDYSTKSVLVGKAGTFLAEAEAAIVEVVAALPPDIRSVIEMIVRESQPSPTLPSSELRPVGIRNPDPNRKSPRRKTEAP